MMKLKKARKWINKRDKTRRDAIKTLREYLANLGKDEVKE